MMIVATDVFAVGDITSIVPVVAMSVIVVVVISVVLNVVLEMSKKQIVVAISLFVVVFVSFVFFDGSKKAGSHLISTFVFLF